MTPFPIESLAGDHRTLGLALAVLLGVAFGFVLERAGLGRVQKLVGQFYGHDMTVLRVLFTAIVTAMAGAVLLSAVGLLDLPFIQLRYPTYLWPMIVGGLVLGAGFVVSGYCPGTCVVAAASGKLDALATIGGLVLGGVAYAELEAAMGAFPVSGALGAATLSQWLGLPAPAVAAAVAALALGAFLAAGRIERLVAARRGAPARAAGPAPEAAPAPARADLAVTP
jgi:hypothetical protein